jgi:hypothetical protein
VYIVLLYFPSIPRPGLRTPHKVELAEWIGLCTQRWGVTWRGA